MRKIPFSVLTHHGLCDQITWLNLAYPGRSFLVSKKWYKRVVEFDLIDDCHFNVRVSKLVNSPLIPELCADVDQVV